MEEEKRTLKALEYYELVCIHYKALFQHSIHKQNNVTNIKESKKKAKSEKVHKTKNPVYSDSEDFSDDEPEEVKEEISPKNDNKKINKHLYEEIALTLLAHICIENEKDFEKIKLTHLKETVKILANRPKLLLTQIKNIIKHMSL